MPVIKAHVAVVVQIDFSFRPLHLGYDSFPNLLCVVLLIETEVVFRNYQVMSVAVEIDEVRSGFDPYRFVREDPLVFQDDWRVIDPVEAAIQIVLDRRTTVVMIAENEEEPASIQLDASDCIIDKKVRRELVFGRDFMTSVEPEVSKMPDVAVSRKSVEQLEDILVHALHFGNVSRISVSALDLIRSLAVLDDIRMSEVSVGRDESLSSSL